ncbi:universal stress protein [Moritella marina ATCC 15381]|uniref:Universal stress protein n=1 Tax=Moritella marina ATCC 15381 TaxID=1202962 RepID=A0A5J6WLW9_MORMI|nr:universal stress protein [Moritella marina]QFI38040.1 universal stress protein [Moritella marina ATCC 15381]
MNYKHILVAVDLTNPSEIVMGKATALARETNAKLSLIYVSSHHLKVSAPGGIPWLASHDIEDTDPDEKEQEHYQTDLNALAEQLDYPVENRLVLMGELDVELTTAIHQLEADLLVCGHHHDLWSRLISSIRKIANAVDTDLLIVYL